MAVYYWCSAVLLKFNLQRLPDYLLLSTNQILLFPWDPSMTLVHLLGPSLVFAPCLPPEGFDKYHNHTFDSQIIQTIQVIPKCLDFPIFPPQCIMQYRKHLPRYHIPLPLGHTLGSSCCSVLEKSEGAWLRLKPQNLTQSFCTECHPIKGTNQTDIQ